MRNVAILHLAEDPTVKRFLKVFRHEASGLYREVITEPFSDDKSLVKAAERVSGRREEYDSVLLVTHGGVDSDAGPDEVQHVLLTDPFNTGTTMNWYEFREFVHECVVDIVFVAITCYSANQELRESFERSFPQYMVGGLVLQR